MTTLEEEKKIAKIIKQHKGWIDTLHTKKVMILYIYGLITKREMKDALTIEDLRKGTIEEKWIDARENPEIVETMSHINCLLTENYN